MLAYTVKNYLKLLSQYSRENNYVLEMLGYETKYTYEFTVDSQGIHLLMKDEDRELLYTNIDNIDKFMFIDKHLEPKMLKETKFKKDGKMFEQTLKVISYEAQLYISLFNLMDKRANFIFQHNGKKYKCFYIEGKTLLVDETDDEYIIKGTNLNHLHTMFNNYKILYVNALYKKLTYKGFLEEQEKIAELSGKRFVKYKLNERVV